MALKHWLPEEFRASKNTSEFHKAAAIGGPWHRPILWNRYYPIQANEC